jgi:hypothetical protein
MFQRTFASLKRWVKGHALPVQADSGFAGMDDRRIWVRYPCDVKTICQTALDATGTRSAARVRNISLGGISLHLDQECQPGTILSLEMPGLTDQTVTVLACVVHVTEAPAGGWVLGCTFARELSDDDLQAFGGKRVRSAAEDQRSWLRFACHTQASYQLASVEGPDQLPARVVNISPSGVRLVVKNQVEAGALLNVRLQSPGGESKLSMLACVVHIAALADDEWALGCNFLRELSPKEFQDLS